MAEKIEYADYIYLGLNMKASFSHDGFIENTLKPIEIIKGAPDQWKLISTAGQVRRCSAIAAVGLQYIVYGRIGELPKLSLCSPSQHYDPE